MTGDASLDWVSAAAPAIVNEEIAGDPRLTAFRAENINAAYAANATEFLHGYFTGQAGALHFAIETEDAARHKMTGNAAESGSVLASMNRVARRFDTSPRPFSTANEEALAAWGRGDYEHAVALDPNFGTAWLSWTESLAARGQRDQAIDVARRALAEPGLRSVEDRARIEVLAAELAGDFTGKVRALAKLVDLSPADPALLNALAEAQLHARDFAGEIATIRKIIGHKPDDGGALNMLGYAEAETGDLDAARKAFADYGKLPGQQINALDSLGEAYFMNGHFADAEHQFLDAYAKDPHFLNGADLSKAAYAHWLAGDVAGADALYKRYLDSHRDPQRAWREAAWLFTSRRRDAAIAQLDQVPDRALAARQLAIWKGKVADTVAQLKARYEQSTPPSDGATRTFYAAALFAAGDRQSAAALLKIWPLPEERFDPLIETLVFPKFLELRKSLGIK